MDVAALSREDRERLAADPATDPAVLTDLAGDFHLLPTLAANPATPPDVRDSIFRDFPHLRPEHPDADPADEVDAAVAAFRRRQEVATRAYARRGPHGSSRDRYVRVVHDDGRVVWTPVSTLAPGTNGFAIASFVLSLIGLSLLGVIFGHIAFFQLDRDGRRGAGFATAGLILGYLGLVVYLVTLFTR